MVFTTRQAWALLTSVLLLWDSARAQGDWQLGQATHYTYFGSGGDTGSCGYGRISSRFPTGRNFCAWPNNDGHMCGQCVEIQCDERPVTTLTGVTYSYPANPGFCKQGASVVVMITDNCPSDVNRDWCSSSKPHCDLSLEAFAELVDDPVRKGIMATKWRMVPCPGPTYQKPAGCTRELGAWATCGDTNGPFPGSCCGKYLKCQQRHQHYWQCQGDPDGNWSAGVSSAPGDNRRRRAPGSGGRRRSTGSKGTPSKPPSQPSSRPKAVKAKPSRRGKLPVGCKRAVGRWGQCGGIGGPKAQRRQGRDGRWAGYCCRSSQCQRSNAWFWQCK